MTDNPQTTLPPHIIGHALAWRDRHAAHVARLIQEARGSFPPCDEDARRPELWKAESWKWLMEAGL